MRTIPFGQSLSPGLTSLSQSGYSQCLRNSQKFLNAFQRAADKQMLFRATTDNRRPCFLFYECDPINDRRHSQIYGKSLGRKSSFAFSKFLKKEHFQEGFFRSDHKTTAQMSALRNMRNMRLYDYHAPLAERTASIA